MAAASIRTRASSMTVDMFGTMKSRECLESVYNNYILYIIDRILTGDQSASKIGPLSLSYHGYRQAPVVPFKEFHWNFIAPRQM